MHDHGALCAILQTDPGKRGLLGRLPAPDLTAVTDLLLGAWRVLITTGFPVWGTGVGETDGPPGAANLARALTDLGKQVLLVTDPCNAPLVEAARQSRVPEAGMRVIAAEEDCEVLLADFAPEVIIALERPGMAADGHFHNMRGVIIDDMVVSTEPLFRAGLPTVGIGDGGNELGMGSYHPWIWESVPQGELICAAQEACYPLAAGVSNWWGWGLAALMGVRTGRDLLPTEEEETALLQALLDAGGLDGVTKEATLSVDDLSLAVHLKLLYQVRRWMKGA